MELDPQTLSVGPDTEVRADGLMGSGTSTGRIRQDWCDDRPAASVRLPNLAETGLRLKWQLDW